MIRHQGDLGEEAQQDEESQGQGLEENIEETNEDLNQGGLWLKPWNIKKEQRKGEQKVGEVEAEEKIVMCSPWGSTFVWVVVSFIYIYIVFVFNVLLILHFVLHWF